MTRAEFKQRIEQLIQLELANASVEEWYDAQVALRSDMDVHASDELDKSVEQFVRVYMRDYDIRRKIPELEAAQMKGIQEWLNEYDASED